MSDPRQTAGLILLGFMVVAVLAGAIATWQFRKRAVRLRASDRRSRKWGIVEGDHPPKV